MSAGAATAPFVYPDLGCHEAATIFPMMEGADFNTLVADIKANGLREPIVTLDGMILDGRNRYRACAAAGVEPKFREWTGDDPFALVLSLNLHRRHLTASQLAMIADKIAVLRDGENKGAQSCAPSQADAARALGVSRRQVQKARIVRAEAEPADVAAVECGEATINAIVKKVRPPLRGPRVRKWAKAELARMKAMKGAGAGKPNNADTRQPEVVRLRRALRESNHTASSDAVTLALLHLKDAALEMLRLREPDLHASRDAIAASFMPVMDTLSAVLTRSAPSHGGAK